MIANDNLGCVKLWEVTATTALAERKCSEAEKPGDNWHFIADFLHLLSAPTACVVALKQVCSPQPWARCRFKVVGSSR